LLPLFGQTGEVVAVNDQVNVNDDALSPQEC
jgi:hypothetical protein